jgi:hypothetical protein
MQHPFNPTRMHPNGRHEILRELVLKSREDARRRVKVDAL